MWTITAAFDGEEVGKTDFQKTKLLKPAYTYALGRKEKALTINSKKISHEQCRFTVGKHTTDEATDPSFRPTLEIFNCKKDKKFTIYRQNKEVDVGPSSNGELYDGDRVNLVNGIDVTIKWEPICVYSPVVRGQGSVSLDSCAALGIKLIYKSHPDATHHLLSQYTATLSAATSLLSLTRLVKPEWLQEVIRLGNLPPDDANGMSLEQHFILPEERLYKPEYSSSLLPSQKRLDIWEPNEVRLKLFEKCRFVCIHEKVRESDTEVGEAIHRGGGSLENFDVHQEVAKFRRTLTRSHAKEGKRVVVVADANQMQAAVGKETWAHYITEAKSFGLEILPTSKVIQAVLDVDIEVLFPTVQIEASTNAGPSHVASSLPDVVPNSMSEEPSVPTETQAPRRRLNRLATRAVSREASVPPVTPAVEPSLEELMARPRRVLTRRAGLASTIIGIDDPSVTLDAPPNPHPPEPKTTAPTPLRRPPKRRLAAIEDSGPSMPPPSAIPETFEEEPPVKKFRALFEASAFDGPQSGRIDESIGGQSTSQILTQTLEFEQPRRTTASRLGVVREDEEEPTQSGINGSFGQRGQKRTLDSLNEDVEMGTSVADQLATGPAAKRRDMKETTVGSGDKNTASASIPDKPKSTAAAKDKAGAPAGKPDTDTAFLKAIASTKRGKRTEDAFDREFNKLKISKPEIEQRDPEEEWAVLAEFGDDSGLRGNFMTIVDMDVFRPDRQMREPVNRSWDGKPNFKKFKKKVVGTFKAKVDVYLNEESSYNVDSAWKTKNIQELYQTQNPIDGSRMESQGTSQSRNTLRKNSRAHSIFYSDDDTHSPVQKTRKAPSRAGSSAPKKAPAKLRSTSKKITTLFLVSDDDMPILKEEVNGDLSDVNAERDETLTLRSESASPVQAPPKRKAPMPIIIDDDSDDDAGFKGGRSKR